MPETPEPDAPISEATGVVVPLDEPVTDETEGDESSPDPIRYDITSYGADYDVEGLVRRLEKGKIKIPSFQRAFVWSLKDSSRFLESLLMGLPVPGVFFCKEAGTNELLVIDGQQRLKSLLFFYRGVFNPKKGDKRQRIFSLSGVASQFEGKTYTELEENDRVLLDDAIIHATIVKQDAPADDDTSINHIFERLNSRGRRLFAQEIRTAISQGSLIDLLAELNEHETWRSIYGKPSPRLKDQELILRFLSLYAESAAYARPMNEFLNKFTKRNRNASEDTIARFRTRFITTIDTLSSAIGQRVFRPERTINAAVFDAVMTGVARRMDKEDPINEATLKTKYEALLEDAVFKEATSRSTADEKFVADRLRIATEHFSGA